MSIDYENILNENMLNVFKDILNNIKNKGLSDGNQLYVTFKTNDKNVKVPTWLYKKYPEEMTIIIQYEYYNINISKYFFEITLSFNNIKTGLKIGFDAIISFADPSANFGLRLKKSKKEKKLTIEKKNKIKSDNVIEFANFKKN